MGIPIEGDIQTAEGEGTEVAGEGQGGPRSTIKPGLGVMKGPQVGLVIIMVIHVIPAATRTISQKIVRMA